MYKSSKTVVDLGGTATRSKSATGDDAPAENCRTHQKKSAPDPTGEVAKYWRGIVRLMITRLFRNQISEPMITLERVSGAHGYFRPDAFENLAGFRAHQIALNPTCFTTYGDIEAYQTLAHELCHLWREECGPRNKNGSAGTRGYHCKHWAAKMLEIGLTPISIDNPGKMTGFRVSDKLVDNGPLDLLIREILITGIRIDWRDPEASVSFGSQTSSGTTATTGGARKPSRKTRAKFTCQTCGLNAWAKPTARLECGTCKAPLKRAAVLA